MKINTEEEYNAAQDRIATLMEYFQKNETVEEKYGQEFEELTLALEVYEEQQAKRAEEMLEGL